jgi:hypothetical protein
MWNNIDASNFIFIRNIDFAQNCGFEQVEALGSLNHALENKL